MLNALIIFVSIALVGFIGYDLIEINNKKRIAEEEERMKKEAERTAALKAIREKSEEEYAKAYGALVNKYGEPTASYQLGSDSTKTKSYLYVFEQPMIVCLKDEIIPFKSILGFSLNDDSETVMHNETSFKSTTTTNTGSMISRAAVGGVLLGGVGALAGATTAKRETITTPTADKTTTTVKHKYSLFINLDDLSNPIREIKLGSDTARAQTVANIFNIIILRNKQ